MTEYATTPSAVEEWNAQRDRTATWVHASLSPELCLPPSRTPSTGSDYARHSLWDGSGWEPPSDCESSVSIPPTMMLQYSDHRKVMISPTQSETSGWKASGRVREGSGTGDGDRTERAQSHRGHIVADSQQQRERRSSVEQIQVAPIVPGAVPSHSSSARLAQAVAAPLPDSHSSSPSSRNLNGSESLDKLRFMARSRSRSPSHTQAALDASTNLSQSYQHAHPASHVSQSHHSSIHSQAQGLSQSNAPSHAAARPSPPPHSNSLSSSHSLSTVPEPIIIHPPAPSASQPSHSTQSGSNSSIYPRSYAPSHYTQQTMQAAAHVPLPPPSTASALLSYYSQSQMRVEPENNSSHHNVSDRPFSQQALMQNNYTPQAPLSGSQRSFSASVQHQTGGSPIYASALLAHSQSHPPTAQVHSHSQSHSQAGRASTVSYGNQAGLGGGYVVVNQANTPEEQAENQGSVGGKSTDSQRHRGSLFNVFGSRGPKSRSLPQVKLEKDAQVLPPPIPDSPESHYSIHSHHSNHSNSYPSPVSPISPPQPIPTSNGNSRRYNPALGPNPPSIVYAPARHGRATRYSPPRIMYMPGTSPRRRELARSRSPAGSVRRAATIASPGAGPLPGERWEREGSAIPSSRHEMGWGSESRREVPRQMVDPHETYAHGYLHDDPNATVGSSMLYGSPHPDIEGNMAGVGTLRSQTRSRSRAKGIAFSASAPPPAGPPTASMIVPPSVTMSKRDAGVTPYPTPPGSSSSRHASPVSRVSDSAPPIPISVVPPSIHSVHTPVEETSSGGLMSRFRDVRSLNTATTPAPPSTPGSTSIGRGRAREREKKSVDLVKAKEARKQRKERRAHSVDSEVSHSSASTYYVIPTAGQKVRIIRTDGKTVTATTTASQFQSEPREQEHHGGGWLKKALKPRFLHLKTASANLKPVPTPDRTNSGSSSGSKKGGRKLVRRGSTSSAALLSRQASVNAP